MHQYQDIKVDTWVKYKKFKNPELKLAKLAVCLKNNHNFNFKWSFSLVKLKVNQISQPNSVFEAAASKS